MKIEERIIKEYGPSQGILYLSKKFSVTQYKVYKILKDAKILPRNWKKIEEEILDLYINHKLCIKEVHEITGIDNKTISSILKKCNIEIISSSIINRQDFYNENFFETINTEEKAYWLGFLYADGNVYIGKKRKKVQLALRDYDRESLENFQKSINSSNKLYKDRNSLKLTLSGNKICEDLIKLGCVPRKSLILKFPTEEQVPKHLLRHFIRGYFDGDGCITKPYIPKRSKKPTQSISILSTKKFLEELRNLLSEEIGFKKNKFYKRYKERTSNNYSIMYGGNNQISLFYNWLYKDATMYMKRKKEKFIINEKNK